MAWKTLAEFARRHSDAEPALREWFRSVERASWRSFAELRADHPTADLVGDKVVFNVRGNRYRLVARVNFESMYVLIRWVGTHAEYDALRIEDR